MRIMKNNFVIFLALLMAGCSPHIHFQEVKSTFPAETGPAPDYSKSENWAALPGKRNNADRIPREISRKGTNADTAVDVFFVHPTTYLREDKISKGWNANLHDEDLNKKTDNTTILYQASVFNAAGRIYAPRYRQAHIHAYFSKDKVDADKALDLAYSDVKKAFDYYLEHYNHGRPIIIASHSQGTTHTIRLLRDYFDGKPLQKQLVAAYLVGMPVYDTMFTVLKPCADSEETGCYVSWRTYARDYYPEGYVTPLHPAVCTNPILWTTDTSCAAREQNSGALLRRFNHIIPQVTDAQVDQTNGVLRISQPHFFGNVFIHLHNYHIADFNLFYMNVRENAILRAGKFVKQNLQ